MSTLRYDDRQLWFVVRTGGNVFDFTHYQETVENAPENHVLVIEEIAFGTGDEELTSVGVLAAVCHREESGGIVFQDEVLIVKGSAVYAVHTSAVALLHKCN